MQKFGGTSVADAGRIRLCAQRAVDAQRSGKRVVVVVSAMGRTTDALMRTAREIEPEPPPRELDQLLSAGEQVSVAMSAIAIHAIGGRAVGLDARQAGIAADGEHGRARIAGIDATHIGAVLATGAIAVVAGFQGELAEGDRATIGRGGSDTTAVALAVALGAEACEINTDAPGVMTADPALVRSARLLSELSWPDMLLLARHGARVVAADAAELAETHGMPLHVRHAALAGDGTLVRGRDLARGPIACAIDGDAHECTVAVVGRDFSETDHERVLRALGPDAECASNAMLVRGVPRERAAALLRAVHDAAGLDAASSAKA